MPQDPEKAFSILVRKVPGKINKPSTDKCQARDMLFNYYREYRPLKDTILNQFKAVSISGSPELLAGISLKILSVMYPAIFRVSSYSDINTDTSLNRSIKYWYTRYGINPRNFTFDEKFTTAMGECYFLLIRIVENPEHTNIFKYISRRLGEKTVRALHTLFTYRNENAGCYYKDAEDEVFELPEKGSDYIKNIPRDKFYDNFITSARGILRIKSIYTA